MVDGADRVIAAIASTQHGVVTRTQVQGAGVGRHAIDHRLKRGRLRLLHRGVYGVGPLPQRHEPLAAAILACGPTAALSHRTAAALWRILGDPPEVGIEVSIRHGRRAPAPYVRVHRVPGLREDETTSLEGPPLTTAGRTLLDLATSLRTRELEQALATADREGLAGPDDLEKLLRRHPRRPGTRLLRALLAREGGPAFTRSEAERNFLALVRKAGLPRPETNVRIANHELDFLWRRERLAVEIDGFAFHSSARAFERDRRRDLMLTAAGIRVVRVTWRQLTREREALLVSLGMALARL